MVLLIELKIDRLHRELKQQGKRPLRYTLQPGIKIYFQSKLTGLPSQLKQLTAIAADRLALAGIQHEVLSEYQLGTSTIIPK